MFSISVDLICFVFVQQTHAVHDSIVRDHDTLSTAEEVGGSESSKAGHEKSGLPTGTLEKESEGGIFGIGKTWRERTPELSQGMLVFKDAGKESSQKIDLDDCFVYPPAPPDDWRSDNWRLINVAGYLYAGDKRNPRIISLRARNKEEKDAWDMWFKTNCQAQNVIKKDPYLPSSVLHHLKEEVAEGQLVKLGEGSAGNTEAQVYKIQDQ